jgi:hypothetical protein
MYKCAALWLGFILCLLGMTAAAQNVQGTIVDMALGKPVSGVNIQNVTTGSTFICDSAGHFALAVEKNQLIIFFKSGYKVQKIRIPAGNIPPYFKVFLEQSAVELPEYLVQDHVKDWHTDSLKYHELYKHELDFPTMSFADVINHPFSALSKKNQQIWAFQKEYSAFEQQKYVDYTFNEKIVNQLTGLQGDSAKAYIRMFRPSYEQLRRMSEYDFYYFIRRSVSSYRSGFDPRRGYQRSAQ